MRRFTKKDWLFLAGLTVAAALLRFYNLGHPPQIIFDETYFANFAHDYLTHTKFFDAEPPLAKFIIAGGIKLFGFTSFGWRFMPALFGTAVIPLFYVFTKRLFGGFFMPLCVGILALCDGLLLVESRTAVIDIFVVFFNLLTYTLLLFSLQARTARRSLGWLAGTGISLGLGLSVKWICLAFVGPAAVLLILLSQSDHPWFRRFFRLPNRASFHRALGITRPKLHNPLLYLLLLGVVPLALYSGIFLLHVPFDSTGQGFLKIHRQIYNYHHNLKATHPYGSPFYTWPLSLRPVAYYFQASPAGDSWQAIVALGNPLLWWTGVVAVLYAVWDFFKYRGLAIGLVLFAFAAHYLPWAAIGRVLFIYHYLGALPFMIIAVAYLLHRIWRAAPKDTALQAALWIPLLGIGGFMGSLLMRSAFGGLPTLVAFVVGSLLFVVPVVAAASTERFGSWGRKQAVVALGIIALAFVFFYPVWTGVGLSPADYYRHMWLHSWI